MNRRRLVPLLAGILAALAVLGVYVGALSILQSPDHALGQLKTDALWVGLVAVGFGVQIGIYAYLRLLVRAARAASATAVASVGTGTSTIGMLACCAHHLADIAPLVALAGAGGLSGVMGFLTEWKFAFIALGLAMNALGIFVTLRTIRSAQVHLATTVASPQIHNKEERMEKDPVCGMQVEQNKEAAKTEYMGKTYYFCSPGCKTAFEKSPAKYSESKMQMSGHSGHCCC